MNQEQSRALGAILRARRLELGYSTHQVGAAAGVPNSTVVRFEQGKFVSPHPDKLVRFAELLSLSLADLFAMAGYLVPNELPNFDAYLLAKYVDLPREAVTELLELFMSLMNRYGTPAERRLTNELPSPAPTTGGVQRDATGEAA